MNCTRLVISDFFSLANNFSFNLQRFLKRKMDKMAKVTLNCQEINNSIIGFQNQISKLEQTRLENEQELIRKLLKENKELEASIEQCKQQLIALEKGKIKVSSTVKAADIKQSNEPVTKTQPVIKQQTVAVNNEETKEKAANKAKKQKPAKNVEKQDNTKQSKEDDKPVDVGRLDMRVGKIVDIQKHPEADSLYLEKIDVGKSNPLTVVSGLVKHVPIDEMANSLVIVLCNMKPAKLRGILSEGMIMCASTPELVEVLRPPNDSLPGDRIVVPGFECEPDSVLNPKKKIFESVAPDLKTDDKYLATYKGVRWEIKGKGNISAKSLVGANIK